MDPDPNSHHDSMGWGWALWGITRDIIITISLVLLQCHDTVKVITRSYQGQIRPKPVKIALLSLLQLCSLEMSTVVETHLDHSNGQYIPPPPRMLHGNIGPKGTGVIPHQITPMSPLFVRHNWSKKKNHFHNVNSFDLAVTLRWPYRPTLIVYFRCSNPQSLFQPTPWGLFKQWGYGHWLLEGTCPG